MNEIWQHVLDEAAPRLKTRPTFFFDLADPESRNGKDIQQAVELIAKFQTHYETYLGLNEKESFAVGGVLGYDGAVEGDAAVKGIAAFIHEKLRISGVVVHPRAYAVVASDTGVVKVNGPFVEEPLISTGAGDHFNAGFCLGKVIGADNETAMQIGVATSGYYVRTAKSPSPADLIGFLRSI
jgi:sugar/nucleoside kinase (ribokinase family)